VLLLYIFSTLSRFLLSIRYYFSIKIPLVVLFSLCSFHFISFFLYFVACFFLFWLLLSRSIQSLKKNDAMEVCGKSKVVRTTILYDFIAINVDGDRETTGVPCQDRRSRVVLGLLTTKRLYSFRILVCDTASGKK